MYNLLIKYWPGAWEEPEGEMDLNRFYGGRLEPEQAHIGAGEPHTLTEANLKRLEGIPTLLLYEGGTPGSHAQVARLGTMSSVQRYGQVLAFHFEPDPDHGYLTRDDVMRFSRHLEIGRANHTHWAVKAGAIPPGLFRLGSPRPPHRSLEAMRAELEAAQAEGNDDLVEVLERAIARESGVQPIAKRSDTEELRSDGATAIAEAPKRIVSVIVGIETYSPLNGAGLSPVEHAVADARAFEACLATLYGDRLATPIRLLDGDATRSSISDELRYAISGLTEDDLFVFYYAGHGYHGADGNRITAADTHAYRLAGTTLSLRDMLIDPLRNSRCRRALGFIDACAVDLPRDGRDVLANLDPAELSAFLNAADYSAVFLSCKPGEQSYSSAKLRHGIWTYHLVRALKGEAPEAAGGHSHVTDVSLKDYLSVAVPAFIRDQTTIKGQQTPQAAIRANRTFAIRSLDAVRAAEPTLDSLGLAVKSQILEGRSHHPLRKLPGWKSHYRAPEFINATTRGFVQDLIEPLVSDELQTVYEATKSAFALSHRQITRALSGASASLHTDTFRLSIEGTLDPEDLTRCRIVRQLTLRQTDADTLAKLDQAFGERFGDLVGVLDEPAPPFDEVVDVVEALERANGGSHRDYPDEERAVYRAADGGELSIDLAAGEIRVSFGMRQSVSGLTTRSRTLLTRLASGGSTNHVAVPTQVLFPGRPGPAAS